MNEILKLLKSTKFCPNCKQDKLFIDFPERKSGSKTKTSWICKECKRSYDRIYWAKTKEKRSKNKKLNSYAIRKRNRAYVKNIKTLIGCQFPGCEIKDSDMLDFDHINRQTKEFNIADMDCYSIETIQKEIDKCQILCANHHRKKTVLEREAFELAIEKLEDQE